MALCVVCLCVCCVRGGALVSVLYDYSQHGDPASQVTAATCSVSGEWVCGIVGQIQMVNSINSVGICFILISKVDGLGHMFYQ